MMVLLNSMILMILMILIRVYLQTLIQDIELIALQQDILEITLERSF